MSIGPRRRRIAVAVTVVVTLAGLVAWWEFTRPSDDVCDGELGPTALVAVDTADGAESWTRLVGSADVHGATVDDDRLRLRTTEHELVVALDTGELVRCTHVGVREVIEVPATTSGARPPEPPDPPDPTVSAVDGLRVEARPANDGSVNLQLLSLTTLDETSAEVMWSEIVPGFVARVASGMVVVLDQTGGSGRLTALEPDTRLTAYSAEAGTHLWQVALAGTPSDAIGVGDLVIAPGATSMVAVDADSGAVVWTVDHGNPAKNGRYSQAGEFARLFATADDATVVGIIEAREPYRD